ncbi:hypothetical protein QQ045_029123 [Rhodiola kirilowii]
MGYTLKVSRQEALRQEARVMDLATRKLLEKERQQEGHRTEARDMGLPMQGSSADRNQEDQAQAEKAISLPTLKSLEPISNPVPALEEVIELSTRHQVPTQFLHSIDSFMLFFNCIPKCYQVLRV